MPYPAASYLIEAPAGDFADAILASDWLAEHDQRIRREALARFADQNHDRMAAAWGGSATWFTTGEKVANLVCDWLRAEGLT